MRSRIAIRTIATGVVTTVAATSFFVSAPTAVADDTVTKAEVAAAINGVEAQNGALVTEPVASTTDTDSAAVVKTDELVTEVPKDPSDGVALDAAGAPPVTINLPGATTAAHDASRLSDGTVVYGSDSGAANAVIPVNGGVQMLVTVADASAPTRYPYKVEVPDGGSVQVNDDGSAAVIDAEGAQLLTVPVPWAKDANGASVPTRFETDGVTLTQVIDHQSGAYSYPIVADPIWVVPAVVVAVVKTAVAWCGIGWLGNSVWQVVWNGWVWREIVRAGKQGCVEGVVGRFIPWHLAKRLIKR